MREYPQVEVESRTALRNWLLGNHHQAGPVWLVTYKKIAGDRYLPYGAIVEEALCFGWIDSLPRALDDQRTLILLSPRKPGSAWSAANRARVARLEQDGQMQPSGRSRVDAAKADGSWDVLKQAESGIAPDDLAKALDDAHGARAGFDAFTLATRKRILEYLMRAKRPGTRAVRIAQIVEGALVARDPLLWKPKSKG